MLVFCYGSNLLPRRLAERTPSARTVCTARLPRHRLAFHKRGRDGSGKCDAFFTGRESDAVLGCVARIEPAEAARLHEAEGLAKGYRLGTVEVIGPRRCLRVLIYLAMDSHVDAGLRPFDWYRRLVLAGAVHHGLGETYVEAILGVETQRDPDRLRARRHLALVAASVPVASAGSGAE